MNYVTGNPKQFNDLELNLDLAGVLMSRLGPTNSLDRSRINGPSAGEPVFTEDSQIVIAN
jgi:hypothetical protein